MHGAKKNGWTPLELWAKINHSSFIFLGILVTSMQRGQSILYRTTLVTMECCIRCLYLNLITRVLAGWVLRSLQFWVILNQASKNILEAELGNFRICENLVPYSCGQEFLIIQERISPSGALWKLLMSKSWSVILLLIDVAQTHMGSSNCVKTIVDIANQGAMFSYRLTLHYWKMSSVLRGCIQVTQRISGYRYQETRTEQ